jgi:hypothetical protein
MWNIYGDAGKGAYLKFKSPFIKYPMALGKVQYGKEHLSLINELDKRANAFIARESLQPKDMELVMLYITACHKALKFQNEHESRLIYSKDYELYGKQFYLQQTKYASINGKIKNALKIPIRFASNENTQIFNELILEEIVLGYGVKQNGLDSVLKWLKEILPANAPVIISHLNNELEPITLYSHY